MSWFWEDETGSKEPVQQESHSHQDGSRLNGGDAMKKIVSVIISIALAIAGVMACKYLYEGGTIMSQLQSQAGTSLAEYYYQAMGHCMIGLSFVAIALLWGLSWIVTAAAWPDNQGIIAALARNNSSGPDNQTMSRSDEARQ